MPKCHAVVWKSAGHDLCLYMDIGRSLHINPHTKCEELSNWSSIILQIGKRKSTVSHCLIYILHFNQFRQNVRITVHYTVFPRFACALNVWHGENNVITLILGLYLIYIYNIYDIHFKTQANVHVIEMWQNKKKERIKQRQETVFQNEWGEWKSARKETTEKRGRERGN